MIDVYSIGTDLALDNGVSAGLAAIRRVLTSLDGVVDGTATRLEHLRRAAASLQMHAGIAEPSNNGSITPPRERGEGANTVDSGAAPLDFAVTTLSRSSPATAAKTIRPEFSPKIGKPIADLGMDPAGRFGSTSADSWSPASGYPSSIPITAPQENQNPVIADFAPIRTQHWGHDLTITGFIPGRYPQEAPPPISAGAGHTVRPSDIAISVPGAVPSRSVVTHPVSPLSLSREPHFSTSRCEESRSPPPSNPLVAETRTIAAQVTRDASYGAALWPQPLGGYSGSPSSVPTPMEPKSPTPQGDMYVDGARLGRWMTDHLVKAAELPRSATTGFDPRMTPTWPGAPVGD